MTNRFEEQVFSNLTKSEIEIKDSLDGSTKIGFNDASDAFYLSNLSEYEFLEKKNLKLQEESEIAQFRSKSAFTKPIISNIVAAPRIDNAPKPVDELIKLKILKRRRISKEAERINNSAQEADPCLPKMLLISHAVNSAVSISESRKESIQAEDLTHLPTSSLPSILPSFDLPSVLPAYELPSVLPAYEDSDAED